MTWEFGGENLSKTFEYKCKLERVFSEHPVLCGVCQFYMGTLTVEAIQDALYTHQVLFMNGTLSRVNPYYIAAELAGVNRSKGWRSDLPEILKGLQLRDEV
jgi:hypothetical protein